MINATIVLYNKVLMTLTDYTALAWSVILFCFVVDSFYGWMELGCLERTNDLWLEHWQSLSIKIEIKRTFHIQDPNSQPQCWRAGYTVVRLPLDKRAVTEVKWLLNKWGFLIQLFSMTWFQSCITIFEYGFVNILIDLKLWYFSS